MKRLLFFVLLLGLLSCSNDDNTTSDEILYILKTYTPSAMLPDTQTFDVSDIIWSFNFEAQTISVIVSDNVEAVVLDEGVYSYSLTDHPCNYDEHMQLVINGTEHGVLIKDSPANNFLTISEACLDGHVLVFERALIL